MILGIDTGYSSTKIVVLDNNSNRIIHKQLIEKLSTPLLEKAVKQVVHSYKDIKKIGITGGKSRIMKLRFNTPTRHIDEISAITAGCSFLADYGKKKNAGKKSCISISCGTGTCIVSCSDGEAIHLGGTGVGGGTIIGLSNRLLGTTDIRQITRLAKKGSLSKVDVQVGDIIGAPIGILPKNITASNFGKLTADRKEDVAKAILNLVAEVIASVSIFSAKSVSQNKIFLCGRVAKIEYIYSRIKAVGRLFKMNFIRLKNPEFATAVGAAILAR